MYLEIYYVDGTFERGIKCVSMSHEPTALFVYPDYRSYIDHLPIQYDCVKSVVAFDDLEARNESNNWR